MIVHALLAEKTPCTLPAYHYIKRRDFGTLVEAADGATPDVFDTPIAAATKSAWLV